MTKTLEEIFRRYEFNKTEPETLVSLVKQAMRTGDGIKDELKRFKEISEKLFKIFTDKKVIVSLDPSKMSDLESFKNICAVGVDGSLQPVEGFGGYWFVPTSCAMVIFKDGPNSQPEVKVSAAIERIKESEYYGVGSEAISRMMAAETKAIMEWSENHDASVRSALFIDGPIVDPPYLVEEKYVNYRCEALTKCLQKNVLVIGCVKRMKARFLIDFITKSLLSTEIDKNLINNFTWDSHMVTAIFSKFAILGTQEILSTIPVDISEMDNAHKAYSDKGIIVYSTYMQKDPTSKPLRLDFPMLKGDIENVTKHVDKVLKATYAWSYPGIDIPLPVFLAHNKCEVRKGCAEILYSEIITRSTSMDPFENFMNEKLRR
jgi:hypothetical protein